MRLIIITGIALVSLILNIVQYRDFNFADKNDYSRLNKAISDYNEDTSGSKDYNFGLLGYHVLKLACSEGDITACIGFCNMDAEFISIDEVLEHEPNCKGII